jgi:acyl transferase domain-containing protein
MPTPMLVGRCVSRPTASPTSFNLLGPSLAVDTACSSSLVALDWACQSIWNGNIELAFAAGVNVIVRPEGTIGFSKASMLAPDGRCRSFDASASGYVRGEGVGVVILKPLARALAERDRIYALVRATAVNQDGRTEGLSVPSRASQKANIVHALRLADVAPDTVQYVEAHGTGTSVGDPIEAAAIGEVYGKAQSHQDRCVIGSIKSNIGHLEPAAGITGMIKAALCLQRRQIPASLHFQNPNPNIPFENLRLRVAQRLEPWPKTNGQPPRAAVNSFGFGGTNAHAILEAPPDSAGRTDVKCDDGGAWMLPLSAHNASALSDLARSYFNALKEERGLKHAALRDICFSASARRTHHEFRLALVAHDKAELAEQIEAFLRGEHRATASSGRKSADPARPVFVCSGMGQQWWAMGRELLAQQPVYRHAVEEVGDLFRRLADWSLLDELTADEKSSRIHQTDVGQRAIFALQIALAALWRSWGIEPAAVFGHSAGEMAERCRWRMPSSSHSTAAVCNTYLPGKDRCWRQAFPASKRRPSSNVIRGTFPSQPSTAPARLRSPAMPRSLSKSTRSSTTQACSAAPCRWRCHSTAQRWSSSKASWCNACAV